MNFKSLFSDFCNSLTDVKLLSQCFATLIRDEDRFKFTWDKFSEFFCPLELNTIAKDAESSNKVRLKGNELYKAGNCVEALKLYSESIALAPSDSYCEHVGYSNRAAVLLYMNEPEEALKNMQIVLAMNIDEEIKTKLLERQKKCLSALNKTNLERSLFKKMEPPELFLKSCLFSSAAEAVGLKESEGLGRHLIAKNNIEAGEVLIIETPFSSVILSAYNYTHCSNCLQRCPSLIPCPKCCTTMYCSSKCLKDSYSKHHLVDCGLQGYLVLLRAEKMELLALRILIEASQGAGSLTSLYETVKSYGEVSEVYRSADHETVYNLVGNTVQRSVADLFHRTVKACVLVALLERFSSFFSQAEKEFKIFAGGLLLRYLQSLPCNAHEVSEFTDKGLEEIGISVYSTLSLINHNCDPNVVRHSYGKVAVLRALHPITSGEQIQDNYGYHYATHKLSTRQHSLLSQYYFTCQCMPCESEWPLYEDLPPLSHDVQSEQHREKLDYIHRMLEKVMKGDFDMTLHVKLFEQLCFLHNNFTKPCAIFNKCEEAIKHCLNFNANHFRPKLGKKIQP